LPARPALAKRPAFFGTSRTRNLRIKSLISKLLSLAREMLGKDYKEAVLELNASDDRCALGHPSSTCYLFFFHIL